MPLSGKSKHHRQDIWTLTNRLQASQQSTKCMYAEPSKNLQRHEKTTQIQLIVLIRLDPGGCFFRLKISTAYQEIGGVCYPLKERS